MTGLPCRHPYVALSDIRSPRHPITRVEAVHPYPQWTPRSFLLSIAPRPRSSCSRLGGRTRLYWKGVWRISESVLSLHKPLYQNQPPKSLSFSLRFVSPFLLGCLCYAPLSLSPVVCDLIDLAADLSLMGATHANSLVKNVVNAIICSPVLVLIAHPTSCPPPDDSVALSRDRPVVSSVAF